MFVAIKEPKYPINDNIEVPGNEIENWQITVDILAKITDTPAALIMRVHNDKIEVFVSSHSSGNVYHRGEMAPLNFGLYCEKVMNTQRELLVPNALNDPLWAKNPDIALGMISYCGLPLTWPDGHLFGTICILDKKENAHCQLVRDLLQRFRDSVQLSLKKTYDSSAERKQAEETIRSLSRFPSEDPNPILRIAQEGTLLYSNDAGLNLLSLWHLEIGQAAPSALQKAVNQSFASALEQEIEMELRERWFSFSVVPIVEEGYANTYARDITERKTGQRQLKEATAKAIAANEAKSRFLATMSHDLRTPLNAVIGFSELALLDSGETALSAKHKENIAHVAAAGRHLLNLVEGLLNLAAIESGKITLQKEPIELRSMLEDLSATYEMLAVKNGVHWFSDIRVTKIISGDRHRIREVINNLVSNAMKFTPVAGSIILGAREDESGVTIFVSDTGCGIEKADLKEIFKPFMQCKTPGVYNRGRGVGLGLSICQQFVELHGGKLTVTSKKGKGSCFTMVLPYATKNEVADKGN